MEVRRLSEVTDVDLARVCGVYEQGRILMGSNARNHLFFSLHFEAIVVDEAEDVSSESLQVPHVNTTLICTEEVLAVCHQRQRVEVVLLACLEACDKLGLCGNTLDFCLGNADVLSLRNLLLD